MNEVIKKNRIINLIGYCLLIIIFSIFLINLYKILDLAIDSDMSSEMIYGKLLHEGNGIFNNNWYSSTGINIFGCSNIFCLVFNFTNNWHIVRIISILLLMTTIYLCFYFLCKQLKIKNIVWYSFPLVLPLSYSYYQFVIKGLYYSIDVIFSLLVVGIFIFYINNVNRNTILKYVLLLLIFIVSLSGIRNIVTITCPIFGTSLVLFLINKLLKKEDNTSKESFILSTKIICISIIGYLLSKILGSYIYNFSTDQYGLTSENLKIADELFANIIKNGWLLLSGISGFNSESIIPIILIIIIIIGSVIIIFKEEFNYSEKFIVFYFVISACIISSTFFASSLKFQDRYLIQSFIFIPVIFAIFVNHFKQEYLKYICVCLLAFQVSFISYDVIRSDSIDTKNKDLINIKNILINKGVNNGYGTFWNANVLTEISDGKIEVWSLEEEHSIVNFNKIYQWLQKKDHDYNFPKEKVFLILSDKEIVKTKINESIYQYMYYDGIDKKLFILEDINQYNKIIK